MKKKSIFPMLCMAAALMLLGSCASDESGLTAGADQDKEADKLFGCLPDEVNVVRVSKDEATAMNLLAIAIDDPALMNPVLRKRRTVVDMRGMEESSVDIELVGPANILWQRAVCDVRVKLADNTFFRGTNFWVYNACAVDYEAIRVESLSPTQVRITRKEGDWSACKPIEIELERKMLGLVPIEEGVYATIVVKLSDTPADSKDFEGCRYITMDQADELGLYHMPFDCEEFNAPMFGTENTLTVEMPAQGDEMTIELPSPAQLYQSPDPYWAVTEGLGFIPLYGTRYYDIDYMEWVFYPTVSTPYDTAVRMTDPFHVTVALDQLRSGDKDEIVVPLSRCDMWHAPDVEGSYGTIRIVRSLQ